MGKKRLRLLSSTLKHSKKQTFGAGNINCNQDASTVNRISAPPAQSSQPHHQRHPKFDLAMEESVLFIGEGNFSFSASMAQELGDASNFFCTAYDSEDVVMEKYPKASEHLSLLNDYQAQLMFGVDATQLQKHFPVKKLPYCRQTQEKGFDKIIFNFPHAGAGIKDQARNIRVNQELLSKFFKSCLSVLKLKSGLIFVSLKQGLPYDEWNIKKVAQDAGWGLSRSFKFDPNDYSGYEHRRTIGFEQGISTIDNADLKKNICRTWVFRLRSELIKEAKEAKKRKRSGNTSDDDD